MEVMTRKEGITIPTTFNGFSLDDSNFITERITFKGFAKRTLSAGGIARREGIKLLDTEFKEKIIVLDGAVIADSASELQTLLDSMKKSFTEEEGNLILEAGRTFAATVKSLIIPDEHYNQSKTDFRVEFICSKPYAAGSQESAVIDIPSGIFTISGTTTISGTLFNRPVFVYTPAGQSTGNTLIGQLELFIAQTGQTVTVSGFGSGLGLDYLNPVTIDLDTFSALEGSNVIDASGGFQEVEPVTIDFTLTANKVFPGGTLEISYNPKFL